MVSSNLIALNVKNRIDRSMSNKIEQVEITMDQAKQVVDLMKSLHTLSKNKHFKKIIDTGYFQDEAIRLVHRRANPEMQTEEIQKQVLRQMDSIGTLKAYFDQIYTLGRTAERALDDAMKCRDEMLEDLDGQWNDEGDI